MDGSGAITLLYSEDFGMASTPAPLSPDPDAEPLPQAFTEAELDRAVVAAVASARDTWAETAAAQRTAAMQALADSLAAARAEACHQTETNALAMAQAALGVVAGTLPHLCRMHGDAEVRALLAHLLPTVARPLRPIVRVHAGLIEALRDDLAAHDDELLGLVEFRPANLPPGDARLSWEDGGLTRDGAAICAAMRSGLADLGLLPSPNLETQDVPDAD